MKRLILLGTFVLVLAACGSSEEAVKEIVVTQEVEVTSVVEVTREVEVTRVVEVTREVFVVATPTPIPVTPTRQAVIPDGWKNYEIISGGMSLAYPPAWEIFSEKPDNVSLNLGAEFLGIQYLPTLDFGPDYDTQVQALKLFYLSTEAGKKNTVKFLNAGKLDAPFTPAYVTAELTFTSLPNNPAGLLITYATNGDRFAYFVFNATYGPNIPDETIDLITKVVRSVEFH